MRIIPNRNEIPLLASVFLQQVASVENVYIYIGHGDLYEKNVYKILLSAFETYKQIRYSIRLFRLCTKAELHQEITFLRVSETNVYHWKSDIDLGCGVLCLGTVL